MTTFKRGDFVAIASVNGGRRIIRDSDRTVVETWAGRIVGPSGMGEGWWLVREVNPATGRPSGTPTAVPENEMSKP